MNDIMIDLETFGLSKRTAVASIGAVFWNPVTGEMGPSLYRVIDLTSCKSLEVDFNTIYWWLEQSEEARKAITIDGKVSIEQALIDLSKFAGSLGNPKTVRYWSNGANFDNAIIEELYLLYGIKSPFSYYNSRDVRTVLGFYPKNLFYNWKIANPRKGAHHTALEDAKYQATYTTMILQELGVEELW